MLEIAAEHRPSQCPWAGVADGKIGNQRLAVYGKSQAYGLAL
jgi:hypothetical protein